MKKVIIREVDGIGKIIATIGETIVGHLKYTYPNDASVNPKTYEARNIEIDEVFVNPLFRRNGIGSKMLKFIENKNPVWISLWTSKEMAENKSSKFYKSNGFKEAYYQPDYYEKGIGTTLFVKKVRKCEKD